MIDSRGHVSERVIGRYGGSRPGPLVVSIGGLHGNEPAGVLASRRVLGTLYEAQPAFQGEFVAVAGNRAALARGCRYIREDLNRIWLSGRIRKEIPDRSKTSTEEEAEQAELLGEIETLLALPRTEAYFLDLHTTSASGSPFSVVADTLHNRRLARVLPIPMVLGLEEHLDGTLLNFINEEGHVAVGVEGGQHEAESAIDTLELAIWKTLLEAGCLDRTLCPSLERLTETVRRLTVGSPAVVEIRYRHSVSPEDFFKMQPGFRNLQPIRFRELLAADRRGQIRASESGRILMPLYQAQGEDGFFVVRRVHPFWLTLALWARLAGLDRLLRFLPGVATHPEVKDAFVVNPRIARWLVVQIFHLMGFRRRRSEDGRLVLSRRRERPRL